MLASLRRPFPHQAGVTERSISDGDRHPSVRVVQNVMVGHLPDRVGPCVWTNLHRQRLRAASLRVCGCLPCAPPGAGHVSAGAKVIVLAQTVAAEMELVHTALDGRLILAAAVASRLSAPLGLGTVAAHSLYPKTPRFEVEPARHQHHSRRQNRHRDAQQGLVRVRSECCRECTKSKEGNAAADSDQPSSGF